MKKGYGDVRMQPQCEGNVVSNRSPLWKEFVQWASFKPRLIN